MFYSIRHLTRFRYSSPVSESTMELRMQPRSEGLQRCLTFQLTVTPRTRVQSYRDYLGNAVHHFDVPSAHRHLMIIAEATVDVASAAVLPPRLETDAWRQLDAQLAGLMEAFAAELSVPAAEEARLRDPLELVMELNSVVYDAIAYVPKSTRVDSPVDDALHNRQGVCQDFAHIMLTLMRRLGIPGRYVSGYLFHKSGERVRSTEGATHAWVEAYLPGIGWVGFDPTNNILAGENHVRTAVGRDYADVPPTRGVFKGEASSELTVAVRVAPSDKAPPPETEMESEDWSAVLHEEPSDQDRAETEQQQQ
jgi:transglutaminase-like putative cysteine protease